MNARLVYGDLDEFYYLSRAIMVKDETHFDRFDVAFGRYFISNPDLPERIAQGWPLNPVDPATMYGGTDKGYTDYPSYRA